MTLQERQKICHGKEWKYAAFVANFIFAGFGQAANLQHFAIGSPDFRNTEPSIDPHARQGAARNLDLQRQVRRRVASSLPLTPATHAPLILKPKTVIRFQTLLRQSAA